MWQVTAYKNAGNGLFPEMLKSELREVRSTIEAYSKSATTEKRLVKIFLQILGKSKRRGTNPLLFSYRHVILRSIDTTNIPNVSPSIIAPCFRFACFVVP